VPSSAHFPGDTYYVSVPSSAHFPGAVSVQSMVSAALTWLPTDGTLSHDCRWSTPMEHVTRPRADVT
jgi:hypothetical protein